MNRLGVAVVGCGYWGPNLIRNFATCELTRLIAICDRQKARLKTMQAAWPHVRAEESFEKILEIPEVEAVAIATHVAAHAPLTQMALQAGKHVLVEKPMATSVQEAESIVRCAENAGCTLMVDHTFLFSPKVRKIKQLLDAADLGNLYYIDSVRINLGLFQSDVNVLWDLAPHDISIVDHFLGRLPRSVAATGVSHTGGDIEDVAYLNLDFGDSLMAAFHVNWLSPIKVRSMIIGGSSKSLVWNDLDPVEPVKVYDRGIAIDSSLETRRGVLVSYRIGDIHSPNLPLEEPLQNAVRHFAQCVRNGARPIADGTAGLRVMRILDAAQRSIKAQGGRITL
jgi:predicted dehydrogenase